MQFSICMVAQNAMFTIKEAICSVLEQSYQDYELLVMDDGSTDDTVSIVKSFEDKRIRLLYAPIKGLLLSRVKLIDSAIGDYIITVDSDDRLEENALETIDAAIKASGADIVNYKGVKVFSNGSREPLPKLLSDKTLLKDEQVHQVFLSLITQDKFTTLWNKAIKRTCIDVDGVSRCPNITIGEDNIILLYTMPNVSSFYYITNELYDYSVSSGITKTFLPESYTNHKRRMLCKKMAIERAGLEPKDFENELTVMSIITVAKICAYFPTRVGNDPGCRERYFKCLDEIRNDKEFWKAYKGLSTRIRFLYRIPLWLVEKHCDRILLCYKNICAKIRLH